MSYKWVFEERDINWDDLTELYRIAPLGVKDPEKLERTYSNSMFKCFLFDGEIIIGAGRALADGADCSYICDIALHPEYQGLGLGKKIVENLVKLSKGHKKIILYSNPGKEGFYMKMGFKRMATAMAIFEDEEAMIANGTIIEEV